MAEKEARLIVDKEFQTYIPPLTEEEYKTLEQSIIYEGCRDPLVVWDNIILDGHNRYNICMKHGLLFKRVEKNFDNREKAKIWILENQLGRRNLNDAQRIDVVDRLFGLKEKRAAEERLKIPTGGTTRENLPTSVKKGRATDNLSKKSKVSRRTYEKGKQVKDSQPELWTKCLDGKLSIDKAYKETKKQEKEQKRIEESKKAEDIQIDDNEIDLRLGDFTEVLKDIPDNSIDLILTDPPYPIEFIEEWEKLAKFAKKKLKLNGFCICYSGQKNIFEVMKRMNKHLDYYWMFALIHSGNKQLINYRNLFCNWKPILIYQNSFKKINNKVDDIIKGTGREKDNHKWQQAEDELEYLINSFSKEGDTILDPFAGSGTTLIAVKKNNRVAYGAEKDKTEYNLAKKRIKNEL